MKILFVDDEEGARESGRETLLSLGYAVDVSSNGKKAIENLQQNNYDLVITDILMPEIDGMELIRNIRKNYPAMQIIAVSGGGRIEATNYLEIARLFGNVEILEKPYSREELIKIIKKVAKTIKNNK